MWLRRLGAGGPADGHALERFGEITEAWHAPPLRIMPGLPDARDRGAVWRLAWQALGAIAAPDAQAPLPGDPAVRARSSASGHCIQAPCHRGARAHPGL